jgi:hypothetical protein
MKWMFMVKLKTLGKGDCKGGAESALSCQMAMGHCFNDAGAVMHHSWD